MKKSDQKPTDNDTLKVFLRDLEKLSKKHGVCIAGCGCMGSPRVYMDSKNSVNVHNLKVTPKGISYDE